MSAQKDIWDNAYSSNLVWGRDTKTLPLELKGKRVLELGVGTGKTLRAILKQKPLEVFALDFSKTAIEICQKEFKNENLILKNADFLEMPIEEESFDIIVCYYFLNNLGKENMKRAVGRMHKGLKPNGTILFEDFAIGDFRQRKRKDNLHCHFFSEEEISNLFSRFRVENLNIKSSSPIKLNQEARRNIISAIILKRTR